MTVALTQRALVPLNVEFNLICRSFECGYCRSFETSIWRVTEKEVEDEDEEGVSESVW